MYVHQPQSVLNKWQTAPLYRGAVNFGSCKSVVIRNDHWGVIWNNLPSNVKRHYTNIYYFINGVSTANLKQTGTRSLKSHTTLKHMYVLSLVLIIKSQSAFHNNNIILGQAFCWINSYQFQFVIIRALLYLELLRNKPAHSCRLVCLNVFVLCYLKMYLKFSMQWIAQNPYNIQDISYKEILSRNILNSHRCVFYNSR